MLQHDENNHSAESEADEFARLLIGDYFYLKKAAFILTVVLLLVIVMMNMKSCSKSGIVINNNATAYLTESETTVATASVQESSELATTITTSTVEMFTLNQEIETSGTTYIVGPEHAVYISKSGNKYHRADCYHINVDNCTMMSEEQAISLGYEPCKTCRPDVNVIIPDNPESNTEYINESNTEYVTSEPKIETTTEIQPIEINRATIEDFMTIPGIDDKKASAILELRSAIHGFQHPYEILYAEGISQEFLASIIDYLYIENTELTT